MDEGNRRLVRIRLRLDERYIGHSRSVCVSGNDGFAREGTAQGLCEADTQFFGSRDGGSDYRVEDLPGKLHVVRQPRPWSLNAGMGERFLNVLKSFLPRHSSP